MEPDELTKGQLLEVLKYISEKFDEQRTWIKENMVCSYHCLERTNMEDIRHNGLESKILDHLKDHESQAKRFSAYLPYIWGALCGVVGFLGDKIFK